MRRIALFVARVNHRLHHLNARVVHFMHHIVHCTYLSAAAIEGHGFYSYAAGALLLMVVVSMFATGEAE